MNANRLYIVNRDIIFSCDKEERLIMEFTTTDDGMKKLRIDKSVAIEMATVLQKMYLSDN